ncbi:MAG: hypothetical protein AB8H79_07980 [Myxococcota bacterium]
MWLILCMVAFGQASPEDSAFELDDSGKPEGELPLRTPEPRISCCVGRDVIKQPIAAAVEDVRACWDGLPKSVRAVPTKRVVEFSVPPGAQVAERVQILGEPHPVDACLIEIFEGLEWASDVPCEWRVRYPYHFAAEANERGSGR